MPDVKSRPTGDSLPHGEPRAWRSATLRESAKVHKSQSTFDRSLSPRAVNKRPRGGLTGPDDCDNVTSPGKRAARPFLGTYRMGLSPLPVNIRVPTPSGVCLSLLENGIVIAKSQCGRSRGNSRSLVNLSIERTMSVLCQYSVDREDQCPRRQLFDF
jgi:hypothetical protein